MQGGSSDYGLSWWPWWPATVNLLFLWEDCPQCLNPSSAVEKPHHGFQLEVLHGLTGRENFRLNEGLSLQSF